MIYKVSHIPKTTPYNRRPGIKMAPQYLTIHSTGNEKSTAQNERDWLTNPQNTRQASWHICVDEKEAIEAIPFDEVAWHAGDGRGPGNLSSIAVEICESGDREKTLQNAAKLVAKLLHERKWGIDRLRRHFDWSGKICPRIFYKNGNWPGWVDFKNRVQGELMLLEVESLFKDINGHWAKESIERLAKLGIVKGDGQGNFNPDKPITRAEVAILLDRLLKLIGR